MKLVQKIQGYDYFTGKAIRDFRGNLENAETEEMTVSLRGSLLEVLNELTEEFDSIHNFFYKHYETENEREAKNNYDNFREAIGDMMEAFELGRVKSYGLYFKKAYDKVVSGELQKVKGLREIINFLETLIDWVR